MPMMATPVAIALVWTMMFHPQLGTREVHVRGMHYCDDVAPVNPLRCTARVRYKAKEAACTLIPLPNDPRFVEAVGHTIAYTLLSVLLPLILGTFAAVVFHAKFPGRGFLRGVFIMPMMATPVAIALVWTMMFHPQLGVLNYLVSLVGIPPQLWVFHPGTVIPSLVLVETWQWTPLVMLIVLGGLASIPVEPYESAQIDGAGVWQMFRYITLPLITPFLFIAGMIRMIDAVKSFDIIFAITQGGPGSASETINLYLYSVAFIYYDLGYGSAIAVIFFLLIVAMAALMLHLRQRTMWNEIGSGA